MAAREDALFRSFRSSADPRALAEVFDRTAPELLRVALHLCGHVADAEDLVQATFLEAIECAAGYDETRRLLPWLLGILVNQARLAQRRRQRIHDHARISVPAASDPVADAEQSELNAALERAIATLPDSYREVFRLALRSGLSANEIAGRLSRSQGTVRSQLVRGWDLLRRMLPPGFAISALVLALPARGLAAVRMVVLARAATLPAIPVIASTVGVAMLAKKTVSSAAIVLLLLCGLWVAWPATAPPQPPAMVGDGALVTAAVSGPATTVEVPAASAAPERTEVTDRSAPAALRVRVLWHNGAPAVDVGVAVRRSGGAWAVLEERLLRTDHGGCVELADLRPGRFSVRTDRSHGTSVEVAAGERRELELRIAEAVTVRGIVRGLGGAPIAGAELHVSDTNGPNRCMLGGRSRSDGTFVLPGMENGRFVAACAAGHAMSDPVEVAGQVGGSVEIELVLKPVPGSVRGRVIDGAGAPVADASVLVGREADVGMWVGGRRVVESPAHRLRTDAAGRFAVSGGVFTRQLLWVRAPGFALWKGRVPALQDDVAEVTVQLRPGGRIRGTFRDEHGSPLAARPVGEGGYDGEAPEWAHVYTMTRGEGGFELEGMPVGKVELYANPETGKTVRATLEVAEGQLVTWDPVAVRGLEIRGRVVDERGAGLDGFQVSADGTAGSGSNAKSGPDGSFCVSALEAGDYRLSASDPGCGFRFPSVTLPAVAAGTKDAVIEVADAVRATARVAGVLLGADGAPVPPSRVALRREPFGGGPWLKTDPATGSFDSGLVPPGRYQLQGFLRDYPLIDLGEFTLAPRQRLDLGTRQLQAPAAIELQLGDGAAKGWLYVRDPDDKLVLGCAIKDGTARTDPLLPGSYHVTGWCEGMSPFAREVELRAGECQRLEVALQRGRQRTFRFTAQGTGPRLDLRIVWRDADGRALWQDGWDSPAGKPAEMRKTFAAGSYSVEAASEDGKMHGSASFTVNDAASDDVLVVALR